MKMKKRKKMQKILYKLCALCLFGTLSVQAEAGEIQNLSDKPQVIELLNGDGGEEKITIEPGRNYSLINLAKVRFAGAEVTIEPDEQYVIWDDTTMGPQRASGRFHN